jgi:hypothetical protein
VSITILEGFDWSGNSSFAAHYKWQASDGWALGPGRYLGQSLQIFTGGFQKTLSPPATGLTMGFAINIQNFVQFIRLVGTANIGLLNNGLLYIEDWNGTTDTTTKTVPFNGWFFLELSWSQFANPSSSGDAVIRVNGETIFTSPAGRNYGSGLLYSLFLAGAGGGSVGYDDLYIVSHDGTGQQSFLGDGEIYTLFPNAPGDSTDFTVVGAASNWQAVSDNPNDGDTSYVTSGNSGDTDLYHVQTVPVTPATIPGIQVTSLERKDNIAQINSMNVVKSSGNIGTGQTFFSPLSYLGNSSVFEKEPVSNNSWTPTLINNLQIGVEVS